MNAPLCAPTLLVVPLVWFLVFLFPFLLFALSLPSDLEDTPVVSFVFFLGLPFSPFSFFRPRTVSSDSDLGDAIIVLIVLIVLNLLVVLLVLCVC